MSGMIIFIATEDVFLLQWLWFNSVIYYYIIFTTVSSAFVFPVSLTIFSNNTFYYHHKRWWTIRALSCSTNYDKALLHHWDIFRLFNSFYFFIWNHSYSLRLGLSFRERVIVKQFISFYCEFSLCDIDVCMCERSVCNDISLNHIW